MSHHVIARAGGRVALSVRCEGRIETQPEAISTTTRRLLRGVYTEPVDVLAVTKTTGDCFAAIAARNDITKGETK